jgi:hypothetical protein
MAVKTLAFSRYRPRIPKIVMFSQSIASMRTPKADSRTSPDDSVTFTPVNESNTGLNPSGAQASPDDETLSVVQANHDNMATSDVQTKDGDGIPPGGQISHDDTIPSYVQTNRDDATPPGVQTSHEDKSRATSPKIVVQRLLSKPKAPEPPSGSDPTHTAESIEGISSISHTSSRDGASSNSTPTGLGPPSHQNDMAQGSNELHVPELFAPSHTRPPTKPPSQHTTGDSKVAAILKASKPQHDTGDPEADSNQIKSQGLLYSS